MKHVVITNTRTAETVKGLLLSDGAMLVQGYEALLTLKQMVEPSESVPGHVPPLVSRMVDGEAPVVGYVEALDFQWDPDVRKLEPGAPAEPVRVTLKIRPFRFLDPGTTVLATRTAPPTPRCPFRKGPRYQPESRQPRNRRQRRWVAREKLERYAYDFNVAPLPGEPTHALKLRIMDAVSPGWRSSVHQVHAAMKRAEDATDLLTATGDDLRKVAELFGVPPS